MSQCNDILRHLKMHGAITPIEALNYYGCFRLAARIHDLRGSGYDIETRTIKKNEKEFAEYALRRAR